MRLLIDESLSHHVATRLADTGHDALHLRDLGLLGARDDQVLAAARQERRTLVSADTDFGTLLALSGASEPSVVLLRRSERRTAERAVVIDSAIRAAGDELEHGAIVVIEPYRLRLRRLPVEGE